MLKLKREESGGSLFWIARVVLLLGAMAWSAFADEVELRAGDIIQLRLLGVPDSDWDSVSGNYTIAGEGTLRLPYLKEEIVAVGLRPSVLAKDIEKLYEGARIYTAPTVVIALDSSVPTRFVTVAGEVRTPGDVPYRHDLTLLAAVSARGGFTDFAKVKKVQLIRKDKVTSHDLKRIMTTPALDLRLRPGDRIIVP
ncbi:MAG: SLBB domain-containing protein [Verrucomicrobia bacterium]|nr:SLBB domain-containing protein [Verrucomicrobiota bacterium]